MKKTQEPEYVAETLEWCNERRKERGKKPLKRMPKGVRADPYQCPCGKTCDLVVGCYLWGFKEQSKRDQTKELPRSVINFVAAFDNGELPQYELK